MTNLTIEVPDDLARGLEEIAASQYKSVQQLALEQLSALVVVALEPRAGSPAAILRVDALDDAMASGRLPVQPRDLFSVDPS